MNLGYQLSQRGHRLLLIDMDPQGSLTNFMRAEAYSLSKTIYRAIVQDKELPVYTNLHGMDLATTKIQLSGVEVELGQDEFHEIYPEEPLGFKRLLYSNCLTTLAYVQ